MILGIDTSNYTTSIAAVDHGVIVSDRRRLLTVKDGDRGLRQQEALFQHLGNLPELYRELMEDIGEGHIDAVACSVRPRPVEGSYMPVFMAGKGFAEVIADTLRVPLYEFSHQEGHAEAASKGTLFEGESSYVFFHLSGGTTEAVALPEYDLCGRTLDISFGQLIDRTGVALGMRFPCGKEMDELALSELHAPKVSCSEWVQKHPKSPVPDGCLPGIKVSGGEVNLSGIESACQRVIAADGCPDRGVFCRVLFDRIADALWKMVMQIRVKSGKDGFLFAGGVSSSMYIRDRLKVLCGSSGDGISIAFGEPDLCRDNAVGIALLGEKSYGA
ncbi:MAG: O-sialoglycoprotein endopeptidase [Eubacterium sp.]|nr:O-sialoglycoprotein endopeptidase [Eubacterium sp.]